MESIIKISSEQGFSQTWAPADVATAPPTLKLLDFVIPANTGTYDLGSCFINLNMEILPGANANQPASATADDALYNDEIVLTQNKTAAVKVYMGDVAQMVRNADMTCSERGMVESIRRVGLLRTVLWNMENDYTEQHDGNNNIGTFFGRRGVGNRTTSFLQIMGNNTSVAGVADTSIKASRISRDMRINLSDLFGVGSALWNTDIYGATRIHLEVMPQLLDIYTDGGNENNDAFTGQGQNATYGAIQPYTVASGLGQIANGGDLGTTSPLVTTLTYDDFQLNMPFFVGQAIQCDFTVTAGAQVAYSIIDAIEYNLGTNATNPPAGSGQVRITTRDSLYNNGTGGAEDVTGITIRALTSDNATSKIRINNAEIVLSNLPSVNGPDGIDYRTYSTEETQGSGATTFNKQIIVEPNAQNLIVANCDTGANIASRTWESYRMSIDNVDVTGNRDVAQRKPLHRERILRTFNNRGQDISNLSLNLLAVAETQGTANQIAFDPIFETLPLTQDQKIVNFKITSAGAQDVVFFKELVKSI
jgi:hypothetical protein